jgi:hypothetical protein
MHRIPNTPIGLVIRKNRFRQIGAELTEVVAALVGLNRSYSSELPTAKGDRGIGRDEPARLDFAGEIAALSERAAIMRNTSIAVVASETESAAVEQTSKRGSAVTRDDIERALAKLERRLRWLIDHTKSDPPTQLLYVQALTAVERQQWRLEQQRLETSSVADAGSPRK